MELTRWTKHRIDCLPEGIPDASRSISVMDATLTAKIRTLPLPVPFLFKVKFKGIMTDLLLNLFNVISCFVQALAMYQRTRNSFCNRTPKMQIYFSCQLLFYVSKHIAGK